jgi:origin recognition complex subunit 3
MSTNGDDVDAEAVDIGYDDSAHQGCYIFRAPEPEPEDLDHRPKKKRKVSKSKKVEKELPLFPKLLGGQETDLSVKLRRDAYERLWAVQQAKIDKIMAESNNSFIEDIARFVRHAPTSESETRLPTGLMVVGKDGGAQQRLLRQWQSDERTKSSEYLIQLDHNQAANVKSALKGIIKSVISSSLGQDGYLDFLANHKRLTPMNYDLELLEVFAKEKKVDKVVISILDIESFDIGVLSDLMTMLASWTDCIPFVLLIGISTTVELFEARLPKSSIHILTPRVFDISSHANNPMHEIFMATQNDPDNRLWFGPVATSTMLEKSKDQETTPEMFSRAIKYAYMSHFFANSLSILLGTDEDLDEETQAILCDAIRNTPSFVNHIEGTLDGSASKAAKARHASELLNDDAALIQAAREALVRGRDVLAKHYSTISDLKSLVLEVRSRAIVFRQNLPKYNAMSGVTDDFFQATVEALQGPIDVEHLLEDLGLFDSLEVVYSECFNSILISDNRWSGKFSSLRDRFDKFRKRAKGEDIRLSTSPSLATALQKEYQEIQELFISIVEEELKANLINPTTLFLHEAFIYNAKTPLAQVFTPGPRTAIERALDRPIDYLACDCCIAEDSSSQPPTALLWRLWCEAGGVVNVRDLWEAFKSTLAPQIRDDEEEDEDEKEGNNERQALALFYRSLAELQILGMLKQSRRKPGVECLAKIGWRGM